MELRTFLRQHLEEDVKGQRPEFGIGFKALRKVEMMALAKKFNLYTPELENTTAEVLAGRLDVWWLEGKFGVGPETEELSELEMMRRELAEMRKAMPKPEEMGGKLEGQYVEKVAVPISETMKTEPGVVFPVEQSSDEVVAIPAGELALLKWADLVSRGVKLDITTHGMKRSELEAAILAKQAA